MHFWVHVFYTVGSFTEKACIPLASKQAELSTSQYSEVGLDAF